MITKNKSVPLVACTIGNAVVDTNIVSTTFNKHNLSLISKHAVKSLSISIGGGALNIATTLSQLEFKTFPICPVGNDYLGTFIKNESTTKAVEISSLITKNTHSHQSTIISIPNQEEPLLFGYKNPELYLEPQDISKTLLAQAALFFIASFEKENIPAVNQALAYIPQNCIVACNLNARIIEENLTAFESIVAQSHLIFMNQYEAELYMKIKGEAWNLYVFFNIIAKKNKTIILTLGRNGVHVFHAGTIYSHPSLTKNAVNTVGAGDAFNACFAGLFVQGYDIKTVILHALLNSSSVIQHHDTQAGILSLEKLKTQTLSFEQLSMRPARTFLTL
jgi:sugar/nucleoside kinase (ribokinase family)